MATTYSNQGAAGVQPRKNEGAGLVHSSIGRKAIASNPTNADIIGMSWLPKGALAIGGEFWATDMDTGTESLDMDIGWADNGAASATLTDSMGETWTNMYNGSASATGFVNSGLISGDAITDLLASGNLRPYNMQNGPVYFDAETRVILTHNAAANVFASGVVYTRTDYLCIG